MVEQYIRSYIRALVPYSTARDEYSGGGTVFLDANENPFQTAVNRYPDPHQREIKKVVSRLKGVQIASIFVGNGSDEAIDLLVRVSTCNQGGVTILPPTYGMYKVAALNNGISLVEAPLRPDFSLDYEAIIRANEVGSQLLFLCSPNNPTGNQYSLDEIERVLEIWNGIVVVDEAYIDFAKGPSAVLLLEKYDRLVILQTFSKAWGMAGVRMGLAFAAPPLIAAMNKLKLPYNVSALSQSYVLTRLRRVDQTTEEIAAVMMERARMTRELESLGCVERVYESQGNFLLVRVTNAQKTFQRLQSGGVIVRDRSKELHCRECLRITVGTKGENDQVIAALKECV